MNVYIASSKKHAGKIAEDLYLRDALIARGVSAEIMPFIKIAVIAKPFDLVIIKSIWGYHKDHQRFLKQINTLKKRKVTLMNDYQFVLWNVDKYKYLREITPLGIVPTVPLRIKKGRKPAELHKALSGACDVLGTRTIVVKPRISESGHLTSIYNESERANVPSAIGEDRQGGFIAQPYRRSIAHGELSIVMLGGMVLYGIRRFPGILSVKKGAVYVRSGAIPSLAKKKAMSLKGFFRKRFQTMPDICRVDLLKNGRRYEILEVELIDPDLYFRKIPEKMKERAVGVLDRRIKK